jgi:DNA-binding transcriptional ArsR family regulator
MSPTASRKRSTPIKPTKPDSGREPFDERLAKAMAHPLRQRILEVLNRRVSSPREVAEELGEKLGDVGYHFRMLREYGVIELVRTEQRRGAVKHFYRATSRAMLDKTTWARLPESARRSIRGHALDQIWTHVTGAVDAGGFEREDLHVSWTTFDLDEKGSAAMSKLVDQTLEKAQAIQDQVAERRARGKTAGTEVTTGLAILHFLPDGQPDAS